MTRTELRGRGAIAAVICLVASAALANPPAQSPRPEARPGASARPAVMVVSVSDFAPVSSERPEKRPRGLATDLQVEKVVFRSQPAPEATIGRKGALCGDPALKGKTIPPILSKVKGCGLEEGVSLVSVAGVALSQPASVDCATASALKTWVETGVKPALEGTGGGVAALQVAGSYTCRGRNNQKGARVSEHGRGRAVDISAILLADGTAITVENGWGSKRYGKVLASMRRSACGPFNTVLGPGSDRHHHDHLHLDTARGRGPYCR
ncbi:extensin family protein [Defluviimonas sp. WL0024]|uniref:Extensin family protein n=2 Tax=Albidovulum TaxID=205889 RepID=A0ABT3J4S0_9RHOB|nr:MULTISPECIES: extensin family protein [Defluviimonas]MCU9849181.1 extensin family protein [Defluviimonas sp. WL0024]MCW3782692.1 extensin family protein [Defluviimonas salinarum]